MVRILLAEHERLVALFSATNDAVSNVENVDLDPLDIGRFESVSLLQLESRFDRGLRMDLGVVTLDYRTFDAIETLTSPVNSEGSGNGLHEALVPFKHFGRTGDAALGEERGLHGS